MARFDALTTGTIHFSEVLYLHSWPLVRLPGLRRRSLQLAFRIQVRGSHSPWSPLSVVSANVTSILLHFHLFLTYDIVLVQESRLTDYGQTYLQQLLNEQGWAGIWSDPRPPQRNDSDNTNLTGKCGGVAILFRSALQFQTAPKSLLQSYPALQSHRFLHGILSTESGPTLHFMTVYGYTGADVHVEAHASS